MAPPRTAGGPPDPLVELAGRIARIGGWAFDVPTREVHWSAEVAAIHELPPDARPDLDSALAHYMPSDRPVITAAFARCVHDGTPFDLELEITVPSGRRRWVRALGRAERDVGGAVVRVVGALVDISEQREAEQSLRDLSERLGTTLENISDGLLTFDKEWRFTYINRRGAEILGGNTPEALIGRSVAQAFPEAVGNVFMRHYEDAMARQQSVAFEAYYEPFDLWLEVVAYPSPNSLSVYYHDINARKKAEADHAALLERERTARQEAEAARVHFRALFEQMPGLFLVLDPQQFTILAASEAYLQTTRRRRDDIVGRTLFEAFPTSPDEPDADGEPNLRASLERVRLSGQPDALAVQRYPIPVPEELGGGFEERFTSAINSPVLAPDGRVISIIHRVEDVTEYVRYRQQEGRTDSSGDETLDRMEADILQRSRELQQLNDHLRVVQRVARIGSWQMELHGNGHTRWSPETARIFGATDSSLGDDFESFLALVHPEDRPRLVEYCDRARRGEGSFEIGYRIVVPDEPVRHLHAMAEIKRNDAGAPHLLCGTVQDVTERHVAELRVQAQLARLQLLQDVTRAIGDRLEVDNVLRTVTDRLQRQLPLAFCAIAQCDSAHGWVRVESIGERAPGLAARLALDEGSRFSLPDNGLEACLKSRRSVYEPDVTASERALCRRLTAAGLRSLVVTPLQVEGSTLGVLVGARAELGGFSQEEVDFLGQLAEHAALALNQADLHGRLQTAYDDLRRTQRAVLQHERLRAVGEMASGIAHDINNAIAPAALYAESLLDKETGMSEGGRRQLQTIQLAIDDVAGTLTRMREFYREEDAGVPHTLVALNQVVRQSIDLTQARWRDMPQREGIAVRIETVLDEALPYVRASEREIREALVNLIFNAVDAMPEGGTLTLRTRLAGQAPDACVVLEVQDTGIGMDEETRRRSMEPFFTTKGERGTGLGLAMVYGTVQRHHAEIEIDSARGQGTTVRIAFQLERETANAPARAALPQTDVTAPAAARALRLLLVDDERAVRASLQELLELDGHQVHAASGGQAAIEAFAAAQARGQAYDAVITDLGMPQVDGREVAAAVKRASPRTPVIMLTGWGRRMSDAGEQPPHVDKLLPKPPRIDDVRAALAQVPLAPGA